MRVDAGLRLRFQAGGKSLRLGEILDKEKEGFSESSSILAYLVWP